MRLSFGLKLCPVTVMVSPSCSPTALHTVMLALDGSLGAGAADDRHPLSAGGGSLIVCWAGVDEEWPPPPWCDEDDADPCAVVAPWLGVREDDLVALLDADFEPCADVEP